MSQVNDEQRAQEPLVQTTILCQSHSLKLRSYLAAGHQTLIRAECERLLFFLDRLN